MEASVLGQLKLTYDQDEDDGYGQLRVVLEAGGFAGVATAALHESDLRASAESLRAFPIDSSAPPTLKAGVIGQDGAEHVIIGICIKPHSPKGTLHVAVELTTAWSPDHDEMEQWLSANVITEPMMLERFRSSLTRIVGDANAEAVLELA